MLNLDKTYVWSDPHLNHKNIIEVCGRNFNSVDEMNEFIIDSVNQTVPHDGHLYWLGDVSFAGVNKTVEMLSRIKRKMTLIVGNHDVPLLKKDAVRELFEDIRDYKFIRVKEGDEQHMFVMSHYPMLSWDQGHRGSYMLHGHCHGHIVEYPFNEPARIMDVGFDSIGDKPISLREVITRLSPNVFPPRFGPTKEYQE